VSTVHTIYVSGPVYSPEELEGTAAIATLLEKSGFEVYLPARDGIESLASPPARDERLREGNRDDASALECAVFALDVYQLVERCDCVVFDMNGRVPDPGSAFRAAVAFAAGKPVVLYKRDHRTKLYGNDNAMISGLSYDFSTVKRSEAIPGEVARAIRKAGRFETPPCRSGGMPPFVSMSAELGREVFKSLGRFKERGPGTSPAELLDELASLYEASAVRRMRS
jgi:nucleoside 2-deoxyribosyltransferase